MEKRHNYVRKVAETAVEIFIRNDKVNVAGLILAGSADFKTELGQSDMFDQVRNDFWPVVKHILINYLHLFSVVYSDSKQKSSRR